MLTSIRDELLSLLFGDAPLSSVDLKTPLSVNLDPGYYALIFGVGRFGSPSNTFGYMPLENRPIIRGYFFSTDNEWFNTDEAGLRFVVVGDQIPEPATILLLSTGLAGIAGPVRRRRKV